MSELHQCKEELANAQEHIKRLERELDLCHEELRRCMRQANNKRGGRKSRKARRGGGQGTSNSIYQYQGLAPSAPGSRFPDGCCSCHGSECPFG
jgi:chromosome segregation ATPase